MHVHTKYSFDAYVFGVTASPDDAYRYAKGAAVKHPLGYEMKLREPLDFYAVTDHGFYMGMIQAYADTSTDISQNDFVNIILKYCKKFKLPFNEKTEKEAIKWSLQRGNRTGRSAWQFIINYAAENNKKIDF